MTKEELIEYKQKLSKLTMEEQKLRDLYLRKVQLGEVDGPITGYPSIDKPWVKYFTKDELDKINIKRTVYQELLNNNYPYKDSVAIEFFGTKITFEELFQNTYKVVKSLQEYHVKKGDYVSFCIAGIPELVSSFYACAYLGVKGNYMTPNMYMDDMAANINESESKIFFVMDKFYDQIKEGIDKSNVKDIVIIRTLNSSKLKYITKKIKPTRKNEIMWDDYIKDGKYQKLGFPINYEKDLPLAVVYSSGTTGRYKGIVLTNDSFQNSVHSYKASGVDVSRGQKFYQIIPPWVSTGLSTSIHLPLTYGASIYMDPRFERDIFVKNIIKHKLNYTVATTSMYEGFLDKKLVGNSDLSFLNYPFEGGEPLKKEVSDKIEQVFKEHGSNAKLLVGYGQCECGATITTETTMTKHQDGNVGIPLPYVNINIVDDEYNSLKYNTRGRILVDTPMGMLEYFNNEKLTNEYFYIDEVGQKWSNTGDIGYMDEDGNLFVEGRSADFSIVNNKKVYNFDIESAVLQDKNVKLCDVLMNNSLLTVHIVFSDEFKQTLSEDIISEELKHIQELIYNKMKDVELVPYSFKIREEFPSAKSGKRDIKKMKEETDGFIYIDKYEENVKKLLKK